jgi:hypothetical protein
MLNQAGQARAAEAVWKKRTTCVVSGAHTVLHQQCINNTEVQHHVIQGNISWLKLSHCTAGLCM